MPEYAIRQSDDFEEKTLGLQWQWQANPDAGFYSLRENPGHLRLYCYRNPGRENLLWYAPNVLTQIPQKQKLSMTVKLSLSGREDGDFGGIGMVGHDYGYAGLYRMGKGIQIRCYRGTVTQPVPVAARTLYSSFVTSQSWAYHTSSPIKSISSHQSMVRLPQRAIMPSFSPSPR